MRFLAGSSICTHRCQRRRRHSLWRVHSGRNTAKQGTRLLWQRRIVRFPSFPSFPTNMSSRFLWRYSNTRLSVYKSTGRNDYITLCEQDSELWRRGSDRMGYTLTRACWRDRRHGVWRLGMIYCTRRGGCVREERCRLSVWAWKFGA